MSRSSNVVFLALPGTDPTESWAAYDELVKKVRQKILNACASNLANSRRMGRIRKDSISPSVAKLSNDK